jgi:serine/threonine-protein kinase
VAHEGDTGFEDDGTTVVIDAFAPGSVFAERFLLGSPLGGGASANVYRATDARAEGGEVALKVLRKDKAVAIEERARFAREGAVLRQLVHPAIVRVLDLGTAADGTPWLAMEALEGVTLQAHLEGGRRMPLDRVVRLVAYAADAIDAAHALGVVHRDLKPANLFLPSHGRVPVKLLDFGLSRVIDARAKLTATDATIGTPRYMAPEQILSARDAGPAVDVYALAVCAYEALAGASPFEANDQAQLLGAILHGRRVPLLDRNPAVPERVGEVLDRAMALAPEDRPSTAVAFAAELVLAAGLAQVAQRGGSFDVPASVVAALAALPDKGGPRFRPPTPPEGVSRPAIPAAPPSLPGGGYGGPARASHVPGPVSGSDVASPSRASGPSGTADLGTETLARRSAAGDRDSTVEAAQARDSRPSADRTSLPAMIAPGLGRFPLPVQIALLGAAALALFALGIGAGWLVFR